MTRRGRDFQHLQQALNGKTTQVVHFFGHGSHTLELLFEDDDGDAKPVSADALARLLSALSGDLRLFICNACHSRAHAMAVTSHVDCAIGIDGTIDDDVAGLFAKAFYTAIFAGRSVAQAFEQARAVCEAERPESDDVFVLETRRDRNGEKLDASELYLLDSQSDDDLTLTPVQSGPFRFFFSLRFKRWHLVWVLSVMVALAILLIALWPPLSIPAFQDGAGVVVAGPWIAGDDIDSAREHLMRELEELGPQYVKRAELRLTGVSDQSLLDAAKQAKASLVVRIEEGPSVRILHVPGTHGLTLLANIPPVRISNPQARASLARLLYVMAWTAVHGPTALPRPIDIPVSSGSKLTRHLTVLAAFLGDYMGRREPAWQRDAMAAIEPILEGLQWRFFICGVRRVAVLHGWLCLLRIALSPVRGCIALAR